MIDGILPPKRRSNNLPPRVREHVSKIVVSDHSGDKFRPPQQIAAEEETRSTTAIGPDLVSQPEQQQKQQQEQQSKAKRSLKDTAKKSNEKTENPADRRSDSIDYGDIHRRLFRFLRGKATSADRSRHQPGARRGRTRADYSSIQPKRSAGRPQYQRTARYGRDDRKQHGSAPASRPA